MEKARNTNTVTQWTAQDNNSLHSLTITKTETTTTKNDDGSVTTSVNKTIATFSTEGDSVGKFRYGSSHGTVTRTTADGKTIPVWSNEPFGDPISAVYAQNTFGPKAWKAAQQAAMPAKAEFFNRAVRNDTKGNLTALAEGIWLAVPVTAPYELPKAIIDVGMALYHLVHGVQDANNPQ